MTSATAESTILAVEPGDVRPSTAPVEVAVSTPRWGTAKIAAALGVACALGAGIGLGVASYLDGKPASRRAEVRLGPVAEMPEIRNGVPEVVRRPVTVRTVPVSPVPPQAAVPSQAAAPAAAPPAPPAPAVRTGDVALPPPPPVAPAASVLASVEAAARPEAVALPTETGALPSPRTLPAVLGPAAARSAETVGGLSALHPLPPPAPSRTVQARAEPQRVAPNRPARTGSSVAAAPPPSGPGTPPATAGEDEIDVLGVKLPSASATGRRIRDGASALLDAVNPF